jgi:hypothetical protein
MFAVWPACNGADGISDIEGKVPRVGASECGQRASFNRDREDLAARIDRFIAEGGKGPYPDME